MARESKIELGSLNNAQVEWSEESGKLTLTIDTNEYDMSGLDITNLNSVSTDGADITGETYIVAARDQNETGFAAGTWVNVPTAEIRDSEDEFNTSYQFVPSETQDYNVEFYAKINAGSAGDVLRGRIQNVTDGTTALGNIGRITAADATQQTIVGDVTLELTDGKKYEIQVQDQDSSFDVYKVTRLAIQKEVVHA